ncbi:MULTISPECIES: ImmA/IrrE family metallo-endopeptidase [Mycobacteriaceae]|nr:MULTISPECIES: ImmA/IrrE family metallo-endopeptidase [Mycobacteriaceae]
MSMALSSQDMLDLVRRLPIPIPWDRDAFVQSVADMRGRPITLIPSETALLGDSLCGLWLARDDDDLILHERGTSDYHIDQIVCHEIGHMLLGHRSGIHRETGGGLGESAWRQALPNVAPESVRAVLGRKDFGEDFGGEQEREAEMFASLLMIATEEKTHQRSMIRRVFFSRR